MNVIKRQLFACEGNVDSQDTSGNKFSTIRLAAWRSISPDQGSYCTSTMARMRGRENEKLPRLMMKHAFHIIYVAVNILKEEDSSASIHTHKDSTLSFPFGRVIGIAHAHSKQ